MPKYPSEIFGHFHSNHTPEAKKDRRNCWCPFANAACYKKSRLVQVPFGVCTAHFGAQEIALCPRRFLEHLTVFSDIAEHHFKTVHDVIVFAEVGLKDIGNFDFVMVKHKPLSTEIEDFVLIEFQTGQTTSTGALVKGFSDYLAGRDVSVNDYAFGLNYYDIWKRTFTQVLNKGIIVEKWRKKIFWVVQEPVFAYFENRYRMGSLEYHDGLATVFSIYDLKPSSNALKLLPTRRVSASIDELFARFRDNPDVPPVESFIKTLKNRFEVQAQVFLRLDKPNQERLPSPRSPTSTGMLRDEEETYGAEAHSQSEFVLDE